MNVDINHNKLFDDKILEISKLIHVSFEFFPPKNQLMEKMLWNSINFLSTLNPQFISVTYNYATKNLTNNCIKNIQYRTKLKVAPHLTCIDANADELRTIAYNYWVNGITHIVALRGDLTKNNHKPKMYGYDLVCLLKEIADFDISVAAYPEMHPEAKSFQDDLINLKYKIEAGANRAITQFFFDVNKYLRFRDRCAAIGINVDIIPGILPISNIQQLHKFVKMTNISIPNWIYEIFNGLDNHEICKIIGVNIAMEMVKILFNEGVKHFHFYTLNKFEMSYAIYYILGVKAKNEIL
ncbi:MAG: methylenetetrahydrofolate reductase [Pantoea sp. Brub]|nr:methylenetetrahydrofolate reductase [Pantoea sp. Brub]